MKDESENFLARWSRRKSESRADSEGAREEPEQAGSTTTPDREEPSIERSTGDGLTPEPAILAELPPIDSITAETDIRAFLAPGVPADLSRAALRRAWSSDPAIRDFVGLVENGWDFNNPDAVPGFGTISAEEVAQLVTQTFGGHDGEKQKDEKVERQQHTQSCDAPSASTSGLASDPAPNVAEQDAPPATENVAVRKMPNAAQDNSDS